MIAMGETLWVQCCLKALLDSQRRLAADVFSAQPSSSFQMFQVIKIG